MRVMVTGASGFVGAALVQRLLGAGDDVVALVQPGTATPAGCQRLEHVLGARPLTLPDGVEAIAHLAQSRAYRAFPGDARQMFAVNVAGAQELLEAAAAARVTRFCLVSTGSVYEPFTAPLVEDAMVAPTSFLGASKLAAEVLAKPFAGLYPVSILRLFAPYGPGQTARLVPDLVRRVRTGEAINLPARSGGMTFAPTYVDDVAAVITTALTEAWSGTWNVAAPGSLTIEGAAHAIGRVVGREPRFERGAQAGAPVVVPDLTRLAARYDIARMCSFADGIAATVAAER